MLTVWTLTPNKNFHIANKWQQVSSPYQEIKHQGSNYTVTVEDNDKKITNLEYNYTVIF